MNSLFEAKKAFPEIKKDAVNPFFKSKYASLGNILDAIEPVLEKHGFYIRSLMESNTLTTQICLTSDGITILESKFKLPELADIQKIGSAITYARRYNLVAMLNLNIEEDDDGNATKAPSKATETISKECKAYMGKINGAENKTDLKAIGAELAKDTKLTANDKDFLRNLYSEKDAKLK